MAKSIEDKLTDVLESVRDLPAETQEALVREFEHRVADVSRSGLSDDQLAEIDRRLAGPREIVQDEAVRTLLRRYNSDL